MKLLLIILQVTLFVSAVQCKQSSRYPDDFSVRMDATTWSYDSRRQIFTRGYYNGDKSIALPLNAVELQLIYDLIKGMRFHNFPGEFECAKYGTFTSPSFTTVIEVRYDGKTTKCSVNSGCPKIEHDRLKKFDELSKAIYEILSAKDEVKALGKSDIIFM